MSGVAMRLVGVCVSVVCACAPRWTQPEFRDEANTRAIATAMRDYACPRENVSVRCDASSATKILDGRTITGRASSITAEHWESAIRRASSSAGQARST